jgi:hypothetical protein
VKDSGPCRRVVDRARDERMRLNMAIPAELTPTYEISAFIAPTCHFCALSHLPDLLSPQP